LPPIVTEVVPTAATQPAMWFFTTTQPAEDWIQEAFDPRGWKEGKSGFGTPDTPGTAVNTRWNSTDIWLVRDIVLPEVHVDQLHWLVHHDEDAEIYVNGTLVARLNGYTVQYDTRPLTAAAKASLKKGKNRIAVHCHQTGGGQYIDVGLVTVTKRQK
ncbi:MAG: glycoside hydrolase family 2, partial [Planctomycetes bacterium]|nr:glycoside hydrolase family 2 [Planctomycetota bacterium]